MAIQAFRSQLAYDPGPEPCEQACYAPATTQSVLESEAVDATRVERAIERAHIVDGIRKRAQSDVRWTIAALIERGEI